MRNSKALQGYSTKNFSKPVNHSNLDVLTLFQQKKPMLTLPDDREKLRSLDETLRNIISYESDRDVRKVS